MLDQYYVQLEDFQRQRFTLSLLRLLTLEAPYLTRKLISAKIKLHPDEYSHIYIHIYPKYAKTTFFAARFRCKESRHHPKTDWPVVCYLYRSTHFCQWGFLERQNQTDFLRGRYGNVPVRAIPQSGCTRRSWAPNIKNSISHPIKDLEEIRSWYPTGTCMR